MAIVSETERLRLREFTPGNAASIRVLERLGFREAATIRMPGEASEVALYEPHRPPGER